MQKEFDFKDCYEYNLLLNLDDYKNDRNFKFYELQNKYLKTHNEKLLWEMYPIIEAVTSSLAKKNICRGCRVPDFESKTMETALTVLDIYRKHPYFVAKKLEDVVFHKVKQIFLDKQLQFEERSISFDKLLELRESKEEKINIKTDGGYYGEE